jgi:hypothetical protein
MAEALKTFREGEDILASETNENNQFLLSKLSDNAAQVQQYVEGEVATIKSNVSSVQATLQNNIDELGAELKAPKGFVALKTPINGTYDLKSVLPDDEYIYLIWVHNYISGQSGNTTISTDIFPDYSFNHLDGDYGRSSQSSNIVCVPVGTGRTVTVSKSSTLIGYMRG